MNDKPIIFTNDMSDYNQVMELGGDTVVEVVYHGNTSKIDKVKNIDWANSDQDDLPTDILMYRIIHRDEEPV